jgi:preprotein translocase subunit YajC
LISWGSLSVVAQTAAPPPVWMQFMPLVLIVGIFYFVAILPMRRRQQQLQRTIDALQKGDRVVTTGGIFGEVSGVEPTAIQLKIADNVKIRVTKSAIAGLQSEDRPAK